MKKNQKLKKMKKCLHKILVFEFLCSTDMKKNYTLKYNKKEFGLSMWTNRNILKTEYWKSHLSEKD